MCNRVIEEEPAMLSYFNHRYTGLETDGDYVILIQQSTLVRGMPLIFFLQWAKIIIIIIQNKIYREKTIPMIALWCPAFSNHG